MANDREFRVLLTGDNASLVAASNQARQALKGASDGADQFAKSNDGATASAGHASTATSGMTREIIVLGHELSQGNYKRFGGSLLVLAEYSKTATAALSALVGPVGLVVGAIAAIGVAVVDGARDQAAFQKSLVLTGNYAGLTADSFTASAKQLAADTHTTIGAAQEALQALVSSGAFGPDLLKPAGDAVLLLAKYTGQSADDIVKDFASMQKGVAEWAATHNEQWHFLSAAQYDYIVQLEKQGKTEEAELVTLTALYDHLGGPAVQNLGYLQRAWKALADNISGAWNALKDFGKADTVSTQIAKIQAELGQSGRSGVSDLDKPDTNPRSSSFGSTRRQTLQAQLASLQAQQAQQNSAASDSASNAETQQHGVQAAAFLNKLHDEEKGVNLVSTELDKYYTQLAAFGAAGNDYSDSQIASDVAFIKKKYSDHKAINDGIAIGKTQFKEQLDGVSAFVAEESDLYKSREDALKRTRSADLVGDQAYLTGLSAAEQDYLNALQDAQVAEELLIAQRRAKADPKEQASLDKQLADSRAAYANAVRDTNAKIADAYLQADDAASTWARNQQLTNQKLTADLITDTDDRDKALAALDIQEKQRQVANMIEGTAARQRAEDQLADYIVLRNRQLTEQLKPEWQKMLEAWQDTNQLMRDASNEFMTGFLKQGEDIFTQWATTGKLNAASLVSFIEQQFLKLTYEKFLAPSVASIGQSIFGSFAGLFGGGAAGTVTSGGGLTAGGSTGGGLSLGGSGFGGSLGSSLSGGLASGGDAMPYRTYLVGEAGPELLRMGKQGGSVVPNKALGGADTYHVTIAPVFQGNGVTRNELVNGMAVATKAAVGQIMELKRRGNTKV